MIDEEVNTLSTLLEEPRFITIEIEKREPVKRKIYAHINPEKGKIISVSAAQYVEGLHPVEIEHELGMKFLRGEENITKWVALKRDDQFVIMKKIDAERQKLHRVKDLPIYELTSDLHSPDVRVEVGDSEVVRIHYRGDTIDTWKHPVKLYFTAEGDPTHLKGVLSLDVNTLNEIQSNNHLPEWPNPVELPLHRADDLSVFTARSKLKVAISRHETTGN